MSAGRTQDVLALLSGDNAESAVAAPDPMTQTLQEDESLNDQEAPQDSLEMEDGQNLMEETHAELLVESAVVGSAPATATLQEEIQTELQLQLQPSVVDIAGMEDETPQQAPLPQCSGPAMSLSAAGAALMPTSFSRQEQASAGGASDLDLVSAANTPICGKCKYPIAEVYRSQIKSKSSKTGSMKFICRLCNCVVSMCSRRLNWPLPGFSQLSEEDQTEFFRDAAKTLGDEGDSLQWQKVRRSLSSVLEKSVIATDAVNVTEESLPLSVWSAKGFDTSLIVEKGMQEQHPIFGKTYRVPLKTLSHTMAAQKVNRMLVDAEADKSSASALRKRKRADEDDADSDEEPLAAPSSLGVVAHAPPSNPGVMALAEQVALLLGTAAGTTAPAGTAPGPIAPAGAIVPAEPATAAKVSEKDQKKLDAKTAKAAERKAEAEEKKAKALIFRQNQRTVQLCTKAQMCLVPLLPDIKKASELAKSKSDLPEALSGQLEESNKLLGDWLQAANSVLDKGKKNKAGTALPDLPFSTQDLTREQKSANASLSKANQIRKLLK